MTRQITILLTIVVSILIAVLLYFTLFSNDIKNFALQHAIPDNAAIIAEFKSPEENIERILNSDWYNFLNAQEDISKITNDVLTLDSIIHTNAAFSNALSGGEMAISLHPYANKTLSFFVCLRLKNDLSQSDLIDFFNTHYNGRFGYNKRLFANETIYEFTDFVNKRKLSLAFKEGLLLASFDGMLCELALLKLKRKLFYGSTTKADFIYHNSNGVNFYINPAFTSKFFNLFYKFGYPNIPFADRFCNQIAFNSEIETDAINFKGLAITHDTLFQFLDLINGQLPVEPTLTNHLPDNFNYAYLLHLSNYQTYYTNVIEYLNARGIYTQYKNYNDSVEQHLQINISENLTRFFVGQAGVFSVTEAGIHTDSARVGMIAVNDEESLRKLLATYAISANKRIETDTLNNYQFNNNIAYCNLGTIMKLYWGDVFDLVPFQYYAIQNNVLLFGSNLNTINLCLNKIKQREVASENKSLKKNLRLLPEKSNMQLLINGNLAYKQLLNQVNGQTHSFMIKHAVHLNRINFAGFIFAGSIDKTFITQGTILFNTEKTKDAELTLSVAIDTTIIGSPVMLYNSHQQDYIMLVQDASYNLHFINLNGITIKTTKLFDKIIGDIYEVDLFNNNKTYYICNSEKYIYVLNEFGEAAYGWPAWIPTGTKYPVFITTLNNEPAILVTGNLYKIAAFNNAGKLINGFNPKNIWPNAISKPDKFIYGNKPFVYVLNQQGKIASYEENGNDKHVLSVDSNLIYNQIFIQQIDTGTLFTVGTDSTYLYQYRYQTIANKPLLVKKISLADLNYLFKLNNGGFILHNHKSYKYFNSNLIELANYNGNDSLAFFKNITVAGKQAIVSLNTNKNELVALDFKNKPIAPFPIPCTSGYSFNQAIDGNYIIFGNKNTLLVYKLRP